MADDNIKLAGDNTEHSEQGEVAIHTIQDNLLEDCTTLAKKAIELGADPEIADRFTPQGMHALRMGVPAKKAVEFYMSYQTAALELIGAKNADLAVLFTDELKLRALTKTLKLGLIPEIALYITTDELFARFDALPSNNPVVAALRLGVPIELAFEFDTSFKVKAWDEIKDRCMTKREICIADALDIGSQTKLDALLAGVDPIKSKEFVHTFQVQAWQTVREIVSDREEGANHALAIDSQTKLDALTAGIAPELASQFINSYQVQAWYALKPFVQTTENDRHLDLDTATSYALDIDTETKLDALHTGIPPELASKFTNPLQVQGWKIIHIQIANKQQSAEFSLEITDEIKLEALRLGVYPGNAQNFRSQIQLDAWNAIKDRKDINQNKAIQDVENMQNLHQLDVFLAGANLKEALQLEHRSQALAYVAHKLPLELSLLFDAQHKIDLLDAGLNPQEASKANWPQAQYLLAKSGPKKYSRDVWHKLETAIKDKINHLEKNPEEIPGFVALTLLGTVTAFVGAFVGIWIVKKILFSCFSLCYRSNKNVARNREAARLNRDELGEAGGHTPASDVKRVVTKEEELYVAV